MTAIPALITLGDVALFGVLLVIVGGVLLSPWLGEEA